MEADAGVERAADRPLPFDQPAQGPVVRVGHVFLEAEGGRHEVDPHPEGRAEGEHHGRRLRGREAGEFVDREFAQVVAAGGRGEEPGAGGGVFLIAPLHLPQGRPDGSEQTVEGGVLQRQPGGGDAGPDGGDEFRGNFGRDPRGGIGGDGRDG